MWQKCGKRAIYGQKKRKYGKFGAFYSQAQLWSVRAAGQRWMKALVQILFRFSTWLHCDFLGRIHCPVHKKRGPTHTAAACGRVIKYIHSTSVLR